MEIKLDQFGFPMDFFCCFCEFWEFSSGKRNTKSQRCKIDQINACKTFSTRFSENSMTFLTSKISTVNGFLAKKNNDPRFAPPQKRLYVIMCHTEKPTPALKSLHRCSRQTSWKSQWSLAEKPCKNTASRSDQQLGMQLWRLSTFHISIKSGQETTEFKNKKHPVSRLYLFPF